MKLENFRCLLWVDKVYISKPRKFLEWTQSDNPVLIWGGTLTSEKDLSNLQLDFLNFDAPANFETKTSPEFRLKIYCSTARVSMSRVKWSRPERSAVLPHSLFNDEILNYMDNWIWYQLTSMNDKMTDGATNKEDSRANISPCEPKNPTNDQQQYWYTKYFC